MPLLSVQLLLRHLHGERAGVLKDADTAAEVAHAECSRAPDEGQRQPAVTPCKLSPGHGGPIRSGITILHCTPGRP